MPPPNPPQLAPAPVSALPMGAADPADLAKRMTALTDATRSAMAAEQARAAALADPRYRAAVRQAEELAAANERATRGYRDMAALEERQRKLDSGRYRADYQASQRSAQETARLADMERRQRNYSDYGRAGGAVANFATSGYGKAVATAAVRGEQALTSHARAGFSGTAEMARFNNELTAINRELAGAFKPAIEWATKGLHSIRTTLESLTPRQQNVVLLFGLTVGGLVAVNRTLGLFGTSLAALTKSAYAAAAAQSRAAGASAVGAAGSAAAGAGMGSRALGMAGRAGPYAALAGSVYALGRAGFDQVGDDGYYAAARRGTFSKPKDEREYKTRILAGLTGPVGLGLEQAGYTHRDAAKSRVGALIGGAGMSVNDNALFPALESLGLRDSTWRYRDRINKYKPEGANGEHRRVSISAGGFEAPGSTYEKLVTENSKMDVNEAIIKQTSILEGLYDMLRSVVGLPSIQAPEVR